MMEMSITLKIACVLYIYIMTKYSSAEEKVIFDRCSADNYYKPYAKVLMKMGDRPVKQLSGSGFLILSEYNRVILCINGPAILYKEAILEIPDDATQEAEAKAYTNGSMGVYEHDCMPINHILKKDLMAARIGNTKGIIKLAREVYGVYLVGNNEDYRLPEVVQFNDDNLNYVPPGKLPSGRLRGHSFAMIGSAPGDAFCTTVTVNNTDDGTEKTYKIKVLTEPGRIVGPHVSVRRGGLSQLDEILNVTLTVDTIWSPCHRTGGKKPTKASKKGSGGLINNITEYDHFATFGIGNRLENSIHSEEKGPGTIFGTTPRPDLVCFDTCDLILTDGTKRLPRLEKSGKCKGQGRLTDNPCYFWRYTADVYIKLEDLPRLHWRQNLLDEVRKIMELACPMVPSNLIILANQIVIGYFSKLVEEKAAHNLKLLDRQHTQWIGELFDSLILCRSKTKPMNFNYSLSHVDVNYPDETYYQHTRSYKKPHPGSTLYYYVTKNATRDPDAFEDAPHIEDRKPPLPSDSYRQEFPYDIELLVNATTAVPLFYHREGIELEKEFNYAIDVAWKAFATAIGYCNIFYQPKKPELFPRLYNSFYEDFLEALAPYWTSSADNDHLRLFLEEFMDNDAINLWLDSCLEASYIYSESNTYRPPRPLIYSEENQLIANYFLELPNDAPILSSKVTNPINNLRRSTKFKRELDARERKLFFKHHTHHKEKERYHPHPQPKHQNIQHEKAISQPPPVEVHVRPKGRIMG